MKSISIFITLFLFTWVSVNAQYNEFPSTWSPEQKTIDGFQADWNPSFQYNGVNASFSVSNDSEYFYLIFNTSDQAVQRKIMSSGMTVTLSGKGGKRNRVKVMFPLKQDRSDNMDRYRPGPGNNTQPPSPGMIMQKRFIESCDKIKVKGIESLKGTVPLENESGLSAAINWDENNNLCYELKVPLKELTGESDPAGLSSKEIKMVIFVHALSQGGGQGSGRKSGGSSGRGGSMMGGGRPGGGSMMGGSRPGGSSRMGGGKPGGNMQQGNASRMMSNDVFKSKITLSNPAG